MSRTSNSRQVVDLRTPRESNRKPSPFTGGILLALLAAVTAVAASSCQAPRNADRQQNHAPAGATSNWLFSPLSVVRNYEAGQMEVSYTNQKVFVYAFGLAHPKPYVKELYTLKGDNVLLDAPPDHPHHHGLMYAVTVNSIDFWGEGPGHGRQLSAPKPGGLAPSLAKFNPTAITIKALGTSGTAFGPGLAVIHHTLHWVSPTNATSSNTTSTVLLIEHRRISVTVDEASQEVAVLWHSDFEVPFPAKNIMTRPWRQTNLSGLAEEGVAPGGVMLSGTEYQGLGLRFAPSWGRVARFLNSEAIPSSAEGKADDVETKWTAVAATLDGRDQMVAMFARPDINRGPTQFFSMREPFAFLSATQGLDEHKQEYAAGQKFSLEHLVTVYPEPKSVEFLKARYRTWESHRGW